MFNWFKNRHKHSWKVLRVAHYDSITGPRTITSWKCQTCGKTDEENRKGLWEVEDFN